MAKDSKQIVAHLTLEVLDMDDNSLNTSTNARWQTTAIRHCPDCQKIPFVDIQNGDAPELCIVQFDAMTDELLKEVVATIKRAMKKPRKPAPPGK